MREIIIGNEKVTGGSLLLSAFITVPLGLLLGRHKAVSYQDGYLFTGVKDSVFAQQFIIALNKNLYMKESLELQKAQLKAQRELSIKLSKR